MLFKSDSFIGRYLLEATFIRSAILKIIVRVFSISYTDFMFFVGKQYYGLNMNNHRLKISCIVTCNDVSRLTFLTEALNSIRDQKYENMEVFIVDGIGGLQNKLSELGECYDPRFLFREFVSRYPYEARNAFLHEVKGDLILFLDDDNLFLPGYFSRLEDWHVLNPSIDVGIFRHTLFKEKFLVDIPISRRLTKRTLTRRNITDTSAMSFKAKSVTRNFWPAVKEAEDWDLLKKCFSLGYRIGIDNSFCLLYRVHSTNRSAPMSNKKII